ncbi:MAG: hypothetical protein MUP55_05100 [Candidatus Aenigmarchaeota archaeon]|nr:hypothetical protein [Candidatus Aenigmarchaeota archaeon]
MEDTGIQVKVKKQLVCKNPFACLRYTSEEDRRDIYSDCYSKNKGKPGHCFLGVYRQLPS